jgi:DNA-binding transcriptional regulator YiaG
MMSETEDELWGVIDKAVFGTSEASEIKDRFKRAFEQREAKESTLGGYLECLRRDEYLKTKEMAFRAGVEQKIWQSWEADRTIPSVPELERVCQNLKLGEQTVQRIFELRSRLPQTILTRLSHYESDQLVAHGAGVVESQMEWKKLHPDIQRLLSRWAEKHDKHFPEDFLQVLFDLKAPQDQENWVIEVLGADDDR